MEQSGGIVKTSNNTNDFFSALFALRCDTSHVFFWRRWDPKDQEAVVAKKWADVAKGRDRNGERGLSAGVDLAGKREGGFGTRKRVWRGDLWAAVNAELEVTELVRLYEMMLENLKKDWEELGSRQA